MKSTSSRQRTLTATIFVPSGIVPLPKEPMPQTHLYSALESQLHQAQNQIAYTRLLADRNGVITARDVEAGQVVSAGQVIVTLADLGEKEVAIEIPEQRVSGVEPAGDVTVELWADGGRRFRGRTREIAPNADPASRTYRVKVTLLEGKDLAQLGMTATVYMTTPCARDSSARTVLSRVEGASCWPVTTCSSFRAVVRIAGWHHSQTNGRKKMRNFTGVLSRRVVARLDRGNGLCLWRDGGSGAEGGFPLPQARNRIYVIFTLRADLFTQFFPSAL